MHVSSSIQSTLGNGPSRVQVGWSIHRDCSPYFKFCHINFSMHQPTCLHALAGLTLRGTITPKQYIHVFQCIQFCWNWMLAILFQYLSNVLLVPLMLNVLILNFFRLFAWQYWPPSNAPLFLSDLCPFSLAQLLFLQVPSIGALHFFWSAYILSTYYQLFVFHHSCHSQCIVSSRNISSPKEP